MKKRWNRLKKRWRKRPVVPACAAGFAVVLAVIVVQLVQGPPNATTLVLVALALILLFGAVAPEGTGAMVDRMTNFRLAGVVEVGLETVVTATDVKPPDGEEDGLTVERHGQNLEAVVEKLKEKMKFIHVVLHLHEAVRKDEFGAITHTLAARRLLDEQEARFVLDLVSDRDLGVKDLPYHARKDFLDATWTFASRFHFVVWDRYVRQELKQSGWFIADFEQDPGHRPDFLGCWNGRWALFTARVGGSTNPERYPTSRRRLERTDRTTSVEGRCIVIPYCERTKGGKKVEERLATVIGSKENLTSSTVKVLRLQGSLREHPERIFDARWNEDELLKRVPD